MKQLTYKNTLHLLLLFILTEITLTVFNNKIQYKELSSVIYFISGILIGLISIYCIRVKQKHSHIKNKNIFGLYYILILILFVFFIFKLQKLFVISPLNYKWADMLPIMKIMTERFIDGVNPYNKIDEIWEGMTPIYLPTMWIWYVIPIILKIDIRWVNVFFILLGLSLILYKKEKKVHIYDFVILFFVAFFLIESLHHKNQDWYLLTEEPLVAGYYLLLAYALKRGNPIVIALAICLCLLSRYVLLLWLISYLFYMNKYKIYLIKICVTIGVVSFLLFVITKAYTQVDVFINTPNGYLSLLLSEQGIGIYTTTIKNSLGIAKFFRLNNIEYLHYFSLICMVIVPIVFFIKSKAANFKSKNLYSIAVLKICLVFFYNLLIIPELYLFITSTLFSLALFRVCLDEEETI